MYQFKNVGDEENITCAAIVGIGSSNWGIGELPFCPFL